MTLNWDLYFLSKIIMNNKIIAIIGVIALSLLVSCNHNPTTPQVQDISTSELTELANKSKKILLRMNKKLKMKLLLQNKRQNKKLKMQLRL